MPAGARYCFLLACLITSFLCSSSFSSPIYVDCCATGPVHNGASWNTAYLSIAQGISAASGTDEVWVRTGTYYERLTLSSYTKIYGGFLGFETSLNQRLIGAFPTIIDASHISRVIDMPVGSRITVDGLTLRNGRADRGGGIRCSTNSTVTLANCRIENCEAAVRGGGVLYDTYAMGTMTNCWVSGNKAPDGGGVVVEYHSYPTLQGNIIAGNHATQSGGGLFCPFHSGAALANCTIAYNRADTSGGGVYCDYGGPVSLSRCILAFNAAPTGGGFYADGSSSQATLSACDWFGNSVGDVGGVLNSLPADGSNITSNPLFLMPESGEFGLHAGSQCAEMGAIVCRSACVVNRIGTAKQLSDTTNVRLTNKVVSCVDENVVYLQEPDRSAAIAVVGLTGCAPGRMVTSVTGSLSTVGASRVLNVTSDSLSDGVLSDMRPLGTRTSWLNTMIGVYARTWGRVQSVSADGFALRDGQYSIHVRYSVTPPTAGQFVIVDGTYGIDGTFLAKTIQTVHR